MISEIGFGSILVGGFGIEVDYLRLGSLSSPSNGHEWIVVGLLGIILII